MIIGKIDAARGGETFGDGCPTLLGRAEQTRELDRQLFPPRPIGPTLEVGFKSHAVDIQGISCWVDLSINRHAKHNRGWVHSGSAQWKIDKPSIVLGML
jgi:hypothetical protein